MKILRFAQLFSRLHALVGFAGALSFSISFLKNKFLPHTRGMLYRVPVGKYVFFFPSLEFFIGQFTEIFFSECYYLEATQEPIRVIDAGTNIGVALLYIKVRAPKAHVACFEPNPSARAVLEKNIEVNNWKESVRVFPFALGKEEGEAEFFVEQMESTSTSGSLTEHGKTKGRTLNSYKVTVDMLSKYIDGPVDIFKMDIEGGEFDVLENLIAHNLISQIKTIQLEYHYNPEFFRRPLSEILRILEAAGFKTFVKSIAPPHRVVGKDAAHAYMVFGWR